MRFLLEWAWKKVGQVKEAMDTLCKDNMQSPHGLLTLLLTLSHKAKLRCPMYIITV